MGLTLISWARSNSQIEKEKLEGTQSKKKEDNTTARYRLNTKRKQERISTVKVEIREEWWCRRNYSWEWCRLTNWSRQRRTESEEEVGKVLVNQGNKKPKRKMRKERDDGKGRVEEETIRNSKYLLKGFDEWSLSADVKWQHSHAKTNTRHEKGAPFVWKGKGLWRAQLCLTEALHSPTTDKFSLRIPCHFSFFPIALNFSLL